MEDALIEVRNELLDLASKYSFANQQEQGQVQSALNALDTVAGDRFNRLATRAVAGDMDAFKRLQRIVAAGLQGMGDILAELKGGRQKNWAKFVEDVSNDTQKKINQAAGAASAALPMWLKAGLGIGLALYIYNTFKD